MENQQSGTNASVLLWIWMAATAGAIVALPVIQPAFEWDRWARIAFGTVLATFVVGATLLVWFRKRFGRVRWIPFLVQFFITTALIALVVWAIDRSLGRAIVQAALYSWGFSAISYVCMAPPKVPSPGRAADECSDNAESPTESR